MWIDLFGKRYEDICVPCELLKKKKEGDFNNQVTKMAYLRNVCQHLPQPSLSLPSDSWTKQPWWQGWEFSMNLATLNSAHQGWPGYSHCWMSSIPTIETDPDVRVRVQFWCGTVLWGDQPATWWQADYLKALSLWNWMTSCFYWNITLTQEMVLASLPTMIPPRLPWLPYPLSWYSTQHYFWTKSSRIPFLVCFYIG